tara:strand:+ start:280524 stop:281912 length:1389 start_codon:yes stop_codon:yes gene_type:complete
MKKQLLILSLLLSIKFVSAQEQTIDITIEQLTNYKEAYSTPVVHLAEIKKIEYHKLVDTQVLSDEYKRALTRIEKYKPAFDKYHQILEDQNKLKTAIENIRTNAELFVNTKGRYSDKEKYLIEAQKNANKNKIHLTTRKEKTRLLPNPEKNYGTYDPTRDIVLYEQGKKSRKSEVKIYLDELKKIKIDAPRETHEYREYVELKKQLITVNKYVTRKMPSTKASYREALMMNTSFIEDLNSLVGSYSILPNQYMLVMKNVGDVLVQYELTSDFTNNHSNNLSKPRTLLKKIDTDEFYYIGSDDLLSYLQSSLSNETLYEIIEELGYEKYYDEDRESYFINTGTAKIRLMTPWLLDQLKENKSFITDLDKKHRQLDAYTRQTIAHSKKLEPYIRLYNMKGRFMKSTDIIAWEKVTRNALSLYVKTYELYDSLFYHSITRTNTKTNDVLQVFFDNIHASKGVLRI